MLQSISVSNGVLLNDIDILNFLFIKESWKENDHSFISKIWCSTTVFNIGNKKMFLEHQICLLNDFWRIMWHWRLE